MNGLSIHLATVARHTHGLQLGRIPNWTRSTVPHMVQCCNLLGSEAASSHLLMPLANQMLACRQGRQLQLESVKTFACHHITIPELSVPCVYSKREKADQLIANACSMISTSIANAQYV